MKAGWQPWTGAMLLLAALIASSPPLAAGTVHFDASSAPETAAWVRSATALAAEWYPRLGNLLASSTDVRLPDVIIRLSPTYEGVAAASANIIEMSAKRVVALPEDSRGVVIHELVHVVQAYPGGSEGWLTEGIADYLRCAVFESMPLADFPRPDKERGYLDSYKVAAGFLLWLESGPAPGIVRQVNAALRQGAYHGSLFKQRTGRGLPELWDEYRAVFSRPGPLPSVTHVWRHSRGRFEKQPDGVWAEFEQDQRAWTFRETSRTDAQIELFDSGRNVHLRLMAKEVRFLSGGNWPTLYRGEWDPSK